MKQAVLVATWPGGLAPFRSLIDSLSGMPWPLYVVINDAGRAYTSNHFPMYRGRSVVIESVVDGYEIGAMDRLLDMAPDVDEFVFLQDTFEVRDQAVLATAFGTPGSVAFGPQFHHYAGKWRREPLLRLAPLPLVRDKETSIQQEQDFVARYRAIEDVTVMFPDFHDGNGRIVERYGRQNLLLENDMLRKYKGTWR